MRSPTCTQKMKTLLLVVGFLSLLHVLQVKGQPNPACNTTACILPDCYCPTHRIPYVQLKLEAENIPQIIAFSFNGRVTAIHAEYVKELFNRRRRNPNGTPIRATFFVTDDREKTDYCTVNRLWSYGHEIASFGARLRTPEWWASASQEDWENEIDAQKEYIVGNGSVDPGHIRGFRSPHLQTGGNEQYEFAVESQYTYDSSMVLPILCKTSDGLCPRLWPFTMDYPIDRKEYPCHTEPCPDGEFPGLWQIPIQPLLDRNNRSCIYLDKCPSAPPRNAAEVHLMLMKNFLLRYEENKAPLLVNLDDYEKWFKEYPWALEGIDRFINTVLSLQGDDIWFVTYNDMIGWVKMPTELRNVRYFAPFSRTRLVPDECEEKSSISALDGRWILISEIVLCIVAFVYLYIREHKE